MEAYEIQLIVGIEFDQAPSMDTGKSRVQRKDTFKIVWRLPWPLVLLPIPIHSNLSNSLSLFTLLLLEVADVPLLRWVNWPVWIRVVEKVSFIKYFVNPAQPLALVNYI